MGLLVIPAVDLKGGRCVRLLQGRPEAETVFSHNPVQVARGWQAAGAKWLHVVNLDGVLGRVSPNLQVLGEILREVEVPVQFGGGMRDLASVEGVLGMGVARAILGTVAVLEPEVVAEVVARFGAERIVVGIDARGGKVAVRGWQEESTLSALDVALRVKELGVERVIYTDIARDGMLAGVNLAATRRLAQRSGLKVIASGGVASLDDIAALKSLVPFGVEGVIVGRALYTGAVDLGEAIALAAN